MSLARVWRRQLYGASGVALVVPAAMLAALTVLALGGGFSQVGVLGQIFAGPPAPSGASPSGPGGGGVARSLPGVSAAPVAAGRSTTSRTSSAGPAGAGRGGAAPAPLSLGGSGRAGGALASGGGAAPVVATGHGGGPGAWPVPPTPSAPAPTQSSVPPGPSPPQPQPHPHPQPTPVDQVVRAVTSVTQQVPAPAGPIATQAVQAAGSAADGLLPSGGAPSGLHVP